MAALDRRNLNLDDFVGLNWSSLIDRANILTSDGSNVEECSKHGKRRIETMTLRKEDMAIYGHYPAHDDFYLVVCSHCGQVVKPQAFQKHCERQHGPLNKLCSQSSPSAPQQRPRPGRPPSHVTSSREGHDSRPSTAPPQLPQHRPAKAQKDGVSLLPVDKSSQDVPPSPPYSSIPRPRVPPWHSGPLPPGGSPPSEKPLLQRAMEGQPDDGHSAPRGPRTYSRTYKKVYKKECDLDKHCGVLDPDRKKLCTRQLMCNIHSIHQRRQVVGRSKTFDQLVTELRTGSKVRELDRPSVCRDAPKEGPPRTEAPESPTGPPHSRRSSAILRSREPSESDSEEGVEDDVDGAVEVEVQPPYPFNQSLLSSEESDPDEPEEARDLPASPWHPKPHGLCTFGSRTLGCSVFTFDRRLHHLRFALSAMVEHHLSAHLWKKIPQVTGLRSRHASTTPSIVTGSTGRAGGGAAPPSAPSFRTLPPSLPNRAAGWENCSTSPSSSSSGQSETKSSPHKPPNTKPKPSTPASGPSRPRNPVGRPSKARLRELELIRSASMEKTRPSPLQEEQSPKRNRDHPLHERGRTHGASVYPSPSSQGPINGTLLLGKKSHHTEPHSPSLELGKQRPPPPLRPPNPTPRGRGRPPGLHRRAGGYDHRGLGKKRKTSGASTPLNPSPSKAPKSHCLSSPSHSSLFSWRGESVGGALARGLDKRVEPQRPKLQH